MKRIDATDSTSIRYKFRKKRFAVIEQMIRAELENKESVDILDVGGRHDYWDYLSADIRSVVHITLLNFKYELDHYEAKSDDLRFTAVIGDGCSMPQYEDNSFDIVHSNSVIEHVGSLSNMAKFSAEAQRVGQKFYIQTPYLWFPIDPHFGVPLIHWLPAPLRANVMNRFKVGFSDTPIKSYPKALEAADDIILVDKTLIRNLFPKAQFKNEKFLLFTKSIVALS